MRSIKIIKSWGKIYEAKPSNIKLMQANIVGFSIHMKKWILLRNIYHSLAFPRGKLKMQYKACSNHAKYNLHA